MAESAPEAPSPDPHTIVKPWLEKQFSANNIKIHGLLQGHVRHECRLSKARILAEGETYLADAVQFPTRTHPPYDAVMVRVRDTATHITLTMTFE